MTQAKEWKRTQAYRGNGFGLNAGFGYGVTQGGAQGAGTKYYRWMCMPYNEAMEFIPHTQVTAGSYHYEL